MEKLNIKKSFLIEEYINSKKSSTEIARDAGCHHNTILRYLKNYGIKARTNSESRKGQFKGKDNHMFGRKGEMCPTFKGSDAVVRKTYYCKNCSGKISYASALYGRKICQLCAGKLRRIKETKKSKKYFCIDCGKRISYKGWYFGTKRCLSCAQKENWRKSNKKERIKSLHSDENRSKTLKALQLRPNKPEQVLINLFNHFLPNEYQYVGNGEVFFDGLNPDFININGQKKIIELFGDYWHNLPEKKIVDKRRMTTYKKYGYKTLIIWEHELKNLNKVEGKLLNFNHPINGN